MDLTRATSQDIGSALDRTGVTWSYDDDGDIRVRFRSNEPPWVDVVFYELDAVRMDFSVRGQFLNAQAIPQSSGETRWEVSHDVGRPPTAVAKKVVTVYLMPRPGSTRLQIHASVRPVEQPRPMHIKVIPNELQVKNIETAFPGFVGYKDDTQSWIAGGVTGTDVDDAELVGLIRICSEIGLDMFEGQFSGWMHASDV